MAQKPRRKSETPYYREPLYRAGYSQGYRTGKRSMARSETTVIAALQKQADYWRQRYLDARDGSPELVDAVDPIDGHATD